MQRFDVADAAFTAEYGIHIGRWSQYTGTDGLPFNAMWCVVPAGQDSAQDCHPEVELAIVVGGTATFAVEGSEVPAPSGTAVLFAPNERHVIHAHDEPVRILSIYWLPDENQGNSNE